VTVPGVIPFTVIEQLSVVEVMEGVCVGRVQNAQLYAALYSELNVELNKTEPMPL